MSDAFEDLGTRQKFESEKPPSKVEKKVIDLRRDSGDSIEVRRLENLSVIQSLKDLAGSFNEIAGESGSVYEVEVTVDDRKVVFWPASDSFFLTTKNVYGTGIKDLCAKILKHLQSQNQTGRQSP